jgi:hypothetical protein
MQKLVVIKLAKHFNHNVAGEICSFSTETAAHILKFEGGEKLAEYTEGVERYDSAAGKVVPLAQSKPK